MYLPVEQNNNTLHIIMKDLMISQYFSSHQRSKTGVEI